LTLAFIPLGVFVSMLPIRIKTGVCIACRSPLEPSQAICPKCGAPQM
jgi:predicted amidophosphoribosyltransferase